MSGRTVRRRLSALWNPPDRVGRTLRNARVKVVGSVLIMLALMIALAILVLR